jgi:trimethylamine-N-oxide reductase (cytochrome c), cytochrome c-type subunit TorC
MKSAERWVVAVAALVVFGLWGWRGAAVGAGAAVPAKTLYASGTAELRKEPGGGVVASLTPGTPVSVTEARGADVHVTVQGWSAAGSNVVVSAAGQRIVLVNLTAPDQVSRQTGSQTTDSYGTVWTQVTIAGWAAASALTPDVQTVWAHGRQLYESHCSNCHSLYASDQYTANQWPGLLSNMADRGGLGGADLALVLKYLQTHAKAP